MTAEADVTVVDWDSFNPEEFTRELRGNLSGYDADKLIWPSSTRSRSHGLTTTC
jgi:hypothetical protein